MGNVFLLDDDLLLNDNNGIDIKQLEQQLEYDAESAILIAALPSMFPDNHELTFGKSRGYKREAHTANTTINPPGNVKRHITSKSHMSATKKMSSTHNSSFMG